MISCPKCQAPCLDAHRYCPACGADLSNMEVRSEDESLIGTTIAGKFILRELIGSGGMGKVFRADQKGVGRTVAVKIMHRHLLGDETASARFTNEARASSTLNHPHSIAVLDFGQTEVGMLYIVMEHLMGRSLDVVIREEYPLTLGRVVNLMCQALDAVDAAHRLNIIHRDLKPENVFLLSSQPQRSDFIKVLDFGIAKMLDLEDRSVTTPGLVPGTPEYMSPEQARGEKLDPRSDVYSLGVILYELLSATVPFRGSSAVATMMSHVQDPVPPLGQRRPGLKVPSSLESIVLWALAKDPRDRISSAAQFAEVLSAWAKVAAVWVDPGGRASSPAVLLDILSEDQLTEIPQQVAKERPYESSAPAQGHRPSPAKGTVGREAEIAALQSFIGRKEPRSLCMSGSSGSGKSRLISHLVQLARDAGFDVLRCRPANGWAAELLAVAHHIALHCLRLTADTSDAASILQAISLLGLGAETVPGVHELFQLPSHLAELPAANRRRERSAAFREIVGHAARQQRLLIVVEEFERCDAASKELLRDLLRSPQEQLAVVVAGSPETAEGWGAEVEYLAVPPLSIEASRTMAQQMFADPVEDELLDRIARAANGQALFVEQLVYAFASDELSIPPSRVGDLIAARTQRLSLSLRSVLQWVSVVNGDVSAETLSEVSGGKVTAAQLDALVAVGLLERSSGPSSRNRARQTFGFSHYLVAVVVYSSIPAEVRREMHQAVGAYLRRNNAPTTTIAYHAYEGDDGPTAVSELEAAGEWASRCLAPQEAIHHYMHALEIVRREWGRGRVGAAELDGMAVDLALRLADVLRQTGDALTAEGVLAEVLSVAAGSGMERARLRLELGRIDLERGNLQRALRHLQLAQADAEATGATEVVTEILRELARAHGLEGDRESAGRLLAMALERESRVIGQKGGPSWSALLSTAQTSIQIGYPERARGFLFDALQQADMAKTLVGKLRVLERVISLHCASSEWQEAEFRASQAMEYAAQIGDRALRAELLVTMARIRRINADPETARKLLDEAAVLSRRVGWVDGLGQVERESEMLRLSAPQAL